QASFGASDYDRLSELGKKQADITGRFFAKAGIHFDAAYSGTLKRQKQTAEIVLNSISAQISDSFDEYDFMAIIRSQLPNLLGKESDQILINDAVFDKYFGKMMKRWASGVDDKPGVETFSHFTQRVINGIKTAAADNPGKTTAIFTSGGVIGMALHAVLNIAPWEALKSAWLIPNCSFSSIVFNEKGLKLETFNSMAHLNVEGLITYR
ncbi:MAG: hypothetical protein BWK80_51270, partial [Desulfobacteraceae bacterium IS3]